MQFDGDDRWGATLVLGGLAVPVAIAARPLAGWGNGLSVRIVGRIAADGDGPPAAERRLLNPVAGHEEAYASLAAAFAADDSVGLLSFRGAAERYRLRSLGEALIVEWGHALDAQHARGFRDEHLTRYLDAVRALPQHLPLGRRESADAGPAAILDLAEARSARGR